MKSWAKREKVARHGSSPGIGLVTMLRFRSATQLSHILRPQTSSDTVKRIVELLYAAREYHPADKLGALTRNPYPAQFNTVEIEQPLRDGEVFKQTVPFAGQIVCGHNPFLYARLVDNLRLRDSTNPNADLIWDERPHPGVVRLG